MGLKSFVGIIDGHNSTLLKSCAHSRTWGMLNSKALSPDISSQEIQYIKPFRGICSGHRGSHTGLGPSLTLPHPQAISVIPQGSAEAQNHI